MAIFLVPWISCHGHRRHRGLQEESTKKPWDLMREARGLGRWHFAVVISAVIVAICGDGHVNGIVMGYIFVLYLWDIHNF
jgi:hypothetical protein